MATRADGPAEQRGDDATHLLTLASEATDHPLVAFYAHQLALMATTINDTGKYETGIDLGTYAVTTYDNGNLKGVTLGNPAVGHLEIDPNTRVRALRCGRGTLTIPNHLPVLDHL